MLWCLITHAHSAAHADFSTPVIVHEQVCAPNNGSHRVWQVTLQSKSVASAVAQFQVCSASFFQLLSDCLTPPTFLRDRPHLDGGAFKIKTVWSVEPAPRSFHARVGSCALLTCDYQNFHLVHMFKSQDYKLIFIINCFLLLLRLL